MKGRIWAAVVGTLAVVGVWAGWPVLGASGPKETHAIPEGFTKDYVLLERKDGSFTVLASPHLRMLASKVYLVGRTYPVGDITNDTVFQDKDQWVSLEDVHRMAEVNCPDDAERGIELRREALKKK